jgi:hypothetical protein
MFPDRHLDFRPADDLVFFPDFFTVFFASFFGAFFEDFLVAFFATAFFGGMILAGAGFAGAFRFFFEITTGVIGDGDIRGSAPSPAMGARKTLSPGFNGSGAIACFAASVTEVAISFAACALVSTTDRWDRLGGLDDRNKSAQGQPGGADEPTI